MTNTWRSVKQKYSLTFMFTQQWMLKQILYNSVKWQLTGNSCHIIWTRKFFFSVLKRCEITSICGCELAGGWAGCWHINKLPAFVWRTACWENTTNQTSAVLKKSRPFSFLQYYFLLCVWQHISAADAFKLYSTSQIYIFNLIYVTYIHFVISVLVNEVKFNLKLYSISFLSFLFL